jgi:hypothetical protein
VSRACLVVQAAVIVNGENKKSAIRDFLAEEIHFSSPSQAMHGQHILIFWHPPLNGIN